MAKAQPPDQLADSAFVIRHMPARQDQLLQVDAAPAHHPITLAIEADSIRAASSASCPAVSRHAAPGALRSINPAAPSLLNRCTQSRSLWRSIAPTRAASLRFFPSYTAAIASNRRT